jgi:predicted RNA-binding protein Jag
MKSIMQEASSIAKAIEQGWIKAGNPVDFSIKILEEPKKNFFGLTVRPAKVAIYFDEKRPAQQTRQEPFSVVSSSVQKNRRPSRQETHRSDLNRSEGRPEARESRERQQPARRAERVQERQPASDFAKPFEQSPRHAQEPIVGTGQQSPRQQLEAQWSESMIGYTQDWMNQILQGVHRESVTFSIEPNNLYLRITLSQPIMDNPEKEKRMLASLALLLLEALKRQFRVGLRRHKIILTHAPGASI